MVALGVQDMHNLKSVSEEKLQKLIAVLFDSKVKQDLEKTDDTEDK